MKTLLLSNINMQPLVALMKPVEVVCGEYNSLLMDLIDPKSPASSDDFERVLCLFDTNSLLGDAVFGEDVPDQGARLIDAVEGFCGRNPQKLVLMHTFKRTTVGRMVTKRLVRVLETLRIAPKGSTAVSDFLNAGADALVKGGQTGIFTPMFFFHVRKPHARKA